MRRLPGEKACGSCRRNPAEENAQAAWFRSHRQDDGIGSEDQPMIDKRGDVWIYPSGRIRLKGKALEQLRRDRWIADKGICKKCGQRTYFNSRYDGDPLAYDMAHIISRGAGGSDTLEN